MKRFEKIVIWILARLSFDVNLQMMFWSRHFSVEFAVCWTHTFGLETKKGTSDRCVQSVTSNTPRPTFTFVCVRGKSI